MSSVSVGDMAQHFTLTRSGVALKSNIQRLSNEMVTGLAEDTAAHLSGGFAPLAGIKSSLARLQGYQAVTTETTLLTDAMQTALSRISEMSDDLGGALLAGVSPNSGTVRISALAADAAQKFEAAVSALNTRVGDRNLFSGVATTTSPLPSGSDLLDTLETVVAGAVGAADVQATLDAWFADPAGYAASYLGGTALAGVMIAPGDTLRIDLTAADPAVRDTLKGLAMAALIDRGVLAGSPEGQADLVWRAGEALVGSQNNLTVLTARLGATQAQISDAMQRNTAEESALNIAQSDLLSIDSYEGATRLQEAQTQLETLYAVTSRMSRLSLVNFL